MRPTLPPVPPVLPPGVRRCPCCWWRPRDADHPLGLCPECRVCLHCERRRTAGASGLCRRCARDHSVSVLYRRGRDFDPAWEQYLRQLTRWHQEQLTLQKRACRRKRRCGKRRRRRAKVRKSAGPAD